MAVAVVSEYNKTSATILLYYSTCLFFLVRTLCDVQWICALHNTSASADVACCRSALHSAAIGLEQLKDVGLFFFVRLRFFSHSAEPHSFPIGGSVFALDFERIPSLVCAHRHIRVPVNREEVCSQLTETDRDCARDIRFDRSTMRLNNSHSTTEHSGAVKQLQAQIYVVQTRILHSWYLPCTVLIVVVRSRACNGRQLRFFSRYLRER